MKVVLTGLRVAHLIESAIHSHDYRSARDVKCGCSELPSRPGGIPLALAALTIFALAAASLGTGGVWRWPSSM
jgi:hypothetical protein